MDAEAPAGWELLRELDDARPEHVETPADYDEAGHAERFARLLAALEQAFGCELESGTRATGWVQDASFFGEVWIPGAVLRGGDRVRVQVSAFGQLATFLPVRNFGLPGSAKLMPEDGDRIRRVLVDHGYTMLPDDAWTTRYDGRNELVHAEGVTWAERFFGHFLV